MLTPRPRVALRARTHVRLDARSSVQAARAADGDVAERAFVAGPAAAGVAAPWEAGPAVVALALGRAYIE